MKFAADFRREAREALDGYWGSALGTGLVASLLGADVISYSTSGIGSNTGDALTSATEYGLTEEEILILLAVFGVAMIVGTIVSLIRLIIGSPVTLGYCKYNLNLVDRNGKAQFSNIFSKFKYIGPAILMQLLRYIYIFLWSLLFVIPGIIKTYSYAMTAYIMSENPTMPVNDAITESRRLMDGNKWRLFCLQFSFIGWSILCAFTCGIGYLWLFPYEEAARAAFYREIRFEKDGIRVERTETPAVTGEASYEDMMNEKYREPEYRDEN